MYANLFLPFPIPSLSAEETVKKSKKGKGKAAVVEVSENDVASGTKSCWSGLGPSEISSVATSIALSGHRKSLALTYRQRAYQAQWATMWLLAPLARSYRSHVILHPSSMECLILW